jgi:aminoglycoside phosphotransferase (APT) family kinase protein
MDAWYYDSQTNARLSTYLSCQIIDFQEIKKINILQGGYSNLTYSIECISKTYVLRQPPPGAKGIKGGHNMEREFTILNKLWKAGFRKIPEVLHYSSDDEIIGTEFYIMSFVAGEVVRSSTINNYLPSLDANAMRTLAIKLCETQAELHKIDIVATQLIEIGKPVGYIARQVRGWHDRYLASQTHELEDFVSVAAWLQDHLPAELAPTLLHNDFKFDNVVLTDDLQKIQAILDWEMCTVGDPRMDIGTTLSYWCEAGDEAFEKNFNVSWLPGCLTRAEYVELYQNLNPAIDLNNILYFYVFGLFKNAIVIQQIFNRYHKGLTQDPRFKHLDKGVARLLQKAVLSISFGEMK